MPSRVLDETRLVAEPVVAVFPHTVEVGLVFPVVALAEAAVLVEPEPHVPIRDWVILPRGASASGSE